MPLRHPDDTIDHFVALVLGHIDREYPNKLDHVINDASQLQSPKALHPIFYGSFDWHSSVHGHWLLVRALRLYPALAQARDVSALLNARFTADNVAAEVAYLKQPLRATFERTYGWAWLLKLAAELRATPSPSTPETIDAFSRWRTTLQPLTDAFVDRYLTYLPKATYPIRVGTHTNTAFGLALALDYANAANHVQLKDTLIAKARAWYLADINYPAWEPDGTDFLSPGLMESELMRRVLAPDEFIAWFGRFFPNLDKREPGTLFIPATVSDRTDGQITHLDGLNLSRAWCWRSIARALPANDARRLHAENAATTHLESALPHVSGDYMGEHWLATFALLAMTE
jgi:hypothetical protein